MRLPTATNVDLELDSPPDLRATIIGDRLVLSDWWPGLAGGGPWRESPRKRRDAGVAIADLHRWRDPRGDGELVVESLSGGERECA